jgi:hypothetical protein
LTGKPDADRVQGAGSARADRVRPTRLGGAVVWMVVWIAAMVIAATLMAGAQLRGDWGPVPVLALWLGVAGFVLWRVLRTVAHGVGGPTPPRRRSGRAPSHVWHDDLPGRDAR